METLVTIKEEFARCQDVLWLFLPFVFVVRVHAVAVAAVSSLSGHDTGKLLHPRHVIRIFLRLLDRGLCGLLLLLD